MYFDPVYILFALPGLLVGLWAQAKLSSAYGKYSRVGTDSGLSGAEAAREILDRAGLQNMPVNEVHGHLTDHYDPTKKALFLSSENYHGRTIAAVGVAAHEAGHALQHQAAYGPMKLRMAMVPVTQFASVAWMGIFVLGFFVSTALAPKFFAAAVAVFGIMTFFQLVTLPVEYDASRRAKERLTALGLVSPHEAPAVNKVLGAAALTYVAALVSSVMHLLYLLSHTQRRN
jgi:Zn-dependent membrane protease YugP